MRAAHWLDWPAICFVDAGCACEVAFVSEYCAAVWIGVQVRQLLTERLAQPVLEYFHILAMLPSE